MSNRVAQIINNLFGGGGNATPAVMDAPTAYNQHRPKGKHGSFCFAPSVNMYFSQDGNVNACCHNLNYSIGSYPAQTLKEIWGSTKALEQRKRMQQYDLSHGCSYCESAYQMGNYEDVSARHFDGLPVNESYPTMMEFVLTNTCNLECVMCRGENSNLIRKNRERLPPIVSPYDDKFLEQLREFIPHLKETRFSGSGEAFSIDMNYKIWDMILELNPSCLIMVQTNGTILTGRVKEMLKKGNFEIGISIDSLQKQTYEAIRVNANFDKVMDNLRYFHQYSMDKGSKFGISSCVMRNNWRELPDFVNYCNSLHASATFHQVWAPKEYALYNLPVKDLEEIYNHLSAFHFPTDNYLQTQNARHYKYFVSVIKAWLDNAPKIQAELAIINALNTDALLPFLLERYEKELATDHTNADDKALLLQQGKDKLAALTSTYMAIGKYDEVFRWMCSIPAHEMNSALKVQTEQFISDQAKKYLHEQGLMKDANIEVE